MKLITLNAWGGKLFDQYIDFIKQYSDVDIFCFQDMLFGKEPKFSIVQKGRLNLFDETKKVLKNFNTFIYRDQEESYYHGESLLISVGCGQAIFVKSNIKVSSNGGFRSHPDSPYYKVGDMVIGDMVSGRCQWIKIESESEDITIINLHGLWQRDSKKRDTLERIEQSKKIKNFFNEHDSKKILCGDFNIINDGNAMDILEDGMINLVKKFNIKSTRSSHYPKEEKFADYILTSPDIKIKDFKVLADEVSDHLPLLVEF